MANYGDTRADGYRYVGYYIARDGSRKEHWLNPNLFDVRRARSSLKTAELHKKRVAEDPIYASKVRAASKYYMARLRRENPAVGLLNAARCRAKKVGMEFTISLEDIVIPTICPVLGISIIPASKNRDNCPSIDRRDNNKGYTKDNIVVVSLRANQLKRDATIEELRRIYEFYKGELK